ncbi:hypothetical protein [Peribacillus asahii]|uniref:hypothetical protein n=1 Tax=Peribacillus asahii TaxID=228899 RepID=UPI003828DF9D
MRKILFRYFFLLISVFLVGCGSDPVQEDLLNYVNKELKQAGELENTALDAYDSVTGQNYKDDQTMYDVISLTVIPTYRDFITELEDVKAETEEVRKLHEQYIEAANIQQDAFNLILTALENQSHEKMSEANAKLAEARKILRDYNKGIEDLAKEHDVELN